MEQVQAEAASRLDPAVSVSGLGCLLSLLHPGFLSSFIHWSRTLCVFFLLIFVFICDSVKEKTRKPGPQQTSNS